MSVQYSSDIEKLIVTLKDFGFNNEEIKALATETPEIIKQDVREVISVLCLLGLKGVTREKIKEIIFSNPRILFYKANTLDGLLDDLTEQKGKTLEEILNEDPTAI